MAEQLLADLPNPNPNFVSDIDEFFNFDSADLDAVNFDDIELNFDNMGDLSFPDSDENFVIPYQAVNGDAFRPGYRELGGVVGEGAADSGSSEVSGERGGCDVGKFLNWGDDGVGGDGEGGTVSSRGSGVSETMNAGSPCSENWDRGVVEQKVKVEELEGNGKGLVKRKKGEDEESTRSSKFRRSDESGEDGNLESNSSGVGGSGGVEEKRKARLLRNRESAQMSRQRKKHHVEELEEKVRLMHSTIADLNNRISYVMAENATLKQQLSGNGNCPPPPPGMFPHPQMGPMCYPWMPYSPYLVKPQGSQVPLVPIPRLKPQQSVSPASKSKKSESKKSGDRKTKKVASITFLGLLFFFLLFGGLVPLVNLRFGGLTGKVNSVGHEFYEQHRGRILSANGNSNGSDLNVDVRYSNEKFDVNNKLHRNGGTENSSEQYAISLHVPRNNKLQKIDGNLIIHSFLSSEKAVASQGKSEANKKEETSLAIRNDLAAALAIPEFGKNKGKNSHVYRNPNEQQRALSSGSIDSLKDQPKSSVDGRLQQWFSEGLAGPMLSSGMCTEVFQFDVSPTSPGAIISSSAVSNISAEHSQNSTHLYKSRNRRILQGFPVSLPGSTMNITEEQVRKSSTKDDFPRNKSGSSMVVSVLVDPREVGDGSGGDSMVGPKSLSRIFVVVLLDSVKYVTYSCVLPRVAPHLVAV